MGFDGFDAIEVVMEIEDIFDLHIDDREYEAIVNLNQLCDLIVSRIGASPANQSGRCISATAFLEARRRLTEDPRFKSRRIRPSTPVSDFLDTNNIRTSWQLLGKTLGVEMPRLEHPQWMGLLAAFTIFSFFVAAISCIVSIGLHTSASPIATIGRLLAFPVLLTTGILLPRFFQKLTENRYAIHVPRDYCTIGALSHLVIRHHIKHQKQQDHSWTEQDVWDVIRHAVAQSAGVPVRDIRREMTIHQLNAL